MVGQTIGKYRIVQRLGRGGMGTVYKAVDETLDREVAIKVLNPDLADTELMKRFRAEAIALAKLNHPNIATIYELSRHNDELLMVMEFVQGEPLDKVSERTGPMPFERASYLCGQVLDALGHAHRVGIVHRDLKPANIMLADTGVVKVMDFGIARMAGTERLTTDGYMMGTPAYMAPEQVMGQDVDGRADLYSVGVVLYRLLTSHLPFKADTPIAMAQKQLKDPPTPLRQFRAELPVWCEQILNRALAKSPADRYQTAEEFRAAITLSAALAPAGDVTTILAASPIASSVDPAEEDTERIERSEVVEPPRGATPSAQSSVSAQTQNQSPSRKTTKTARSGAIAALVIMILAVGTAVVLLRLKARSVEPAPPASASSAPTTAPPESPPAVTAPTSAPAQPAGSAGVPSGSGATAPRRGGARPTAKPSVAEPGTPSGAAPVTSPEESGRGAAEPPAAPPETVAPAAKLPTLSFSPIRLLTFSGTDPREREVRLQLGESAVTLSGVQTVAGESKSAPYESIIAIFQSRSREPMWVGPNGTVNPVVRIDGGMFGFLKGDRDWLTIRTKTEFIPIRSERAVLERVAVALAERTGLSVVRAERRRNRD